MKVTNTKVTSFSITDIAGLDPILVIAREYDDPVYHKATLVVQCYDRAWTCYWGNMYDSLENFITSANLDYITGCLVCGTANLISIDDPEAEELRESERRWVKSIADAIKEAVKNGALAGMKEAA